ncbi:S8 family serine peptidase [Actinocrispum sp. NPDC049592]|uniref:S8 family serine peptidase n=1 Tax=Actinocrispum sp. NPDC049592 TaxID=3154835 RepID=UPI003424589D
MGIRRLAAAMVAGVVAVSLVGPVSVSAAPGDGRMDAAVREAAGLGAGLSAKKAKVAPLRTDRSGRVVVYVEGRDAGALRRSVAAVGGEVSDAGTGRVRAAIPPKALARLARSEGVVEVRRPDVPVEMEVVSEEVQPSGALAWHGDGKKGAGVKVGVLDVGFARLDQAKAAGEIPNETTVYNGQCGEDQFSAHGTTMAEIVHDMAPQAQLFLACVTDAMDFDDAARWLKDQGVTVVNVSIGFPGTGRGSGIADATQSDWSPATTVAWLRENGIVVVAAAGNEADKHMTGPTADPDGNGWINVSGSSEAQGFTVGAGATVTLELKWDAWPRTTDDLDLYVMDIQAKPSSLNDPHLGGRYSVRPQKTTPGGSPPVETIAFTNTDSQSQTYWAYLKTNGARQTLRYDLTGYGAVSGLSYRVTAGSIAEPASSPYVLAVGAITPANAAAGAVESYSGRGPTIDGRIKPDLVGFTDVSTYTGGVVPNQTASGTSAAAAHVTGAAALYKGANPALDPAQLEALLLDSSSRPGRSNDFGYGVLNVGAARVPQPPGGDAYTTLPSSARVLDTTSGVGGHNGPLTAGETFTLRIPNLPPDATAVAVNLAGVSATEPTNVEVFADVSTGATTLPIIPGSTRSVMTVATLDPRDKVIRLRNASGNTHVTVDVVGYFSTTSSASTYVPAQRPIRLAQPASRLGAGTSTAWTLPVRGVSGIAGNATAAMVTVTTTAASQGTHVRLYAKDWPDTWAFSPAVSESLTYTYMVPVGDDGAIRIGNDAGSVDVTIDVAGWFASGPGARYVPLHYGTPVFSTTAGIGTTMSAFGPGEARQFRVTAAPRIPYNATSAMLNVSSPHAEARSQLALWPQEYGWSGAPALSAEAVSSCSPSPGWAPATSTAIAPLGSSGAINLRNYANTVDATVTAAGYFVGGQTAAPPALANPIGRWTFDEGTGNAVADSAGSNPAGMRGGAGWTNGVAAKAGWFDGSTGDAATSGPVIRTDQSFTVAAWAYLTDRRPGAFLLGQDGNHASGFYLEYLNAGNGGDRWSFSALSSDSGSADAMRATGSAFPPLNTWTFVAGVYDAQAHQMRLYVNGALAGVRDNATLWRADGPFTIGSAKFNDARGYMPRGVDDVRAYNVALSATAVRDLYSSYQTPPAIPLPPAGDAQHWYGWDSPDGNLTSAPAVTSWGSNRLDVFAKGANNVLYHRAYDGSWSEWESLGDGLASSPAAVAWGPGRFDLFARGYDNALYHKAFDGAWHDWESLGGGMQYAPAVASWAPGRLDVFVTGTDGALYHKPYDGQWRDWARLGGTLTAGPSAVSWGIDRIDIVGRGTDNALYHTGWNAGWFGWQSLGGALNTAPAIASWGFNRLDIFAADTNNNLHHKAYDGIWHDWDWQGGYLTSDPSAVSWGPNRIDIFNRGIDSSKMCHMTWG